MQLQLLTNDVSTGAVSNPWEEEVPPLWTSWVWQKVTLGLKELLSFLRNAELCAAEETKFYCLTFPAEVEKLFDNCVIFLMGNTINPVPLDRLSPAVLRCELWCFQCVQCQMCFHQYHTGWVSIARGCIHLSLSLLFLFRVFLRAINKFAETMNQKFLENMNFEVQVSILGF